MVDCWVDRHNTSAEARALVDALGLPVYTTGLGKSIIDETRKLYVSLYYGGTSRPGNQHAFEAHDFILVLGDYPIDANCGGWTRAVPDEFATYINVNDVAMKGWKFTRPVPIRATIASLTKLSKSFKIPGAPTPRTSY